MISLSCCIPGGSFMPEGEGAIPMSPRERLENGYRVITGLGYDAVEATVGLVAKLSDADIAALVEKRRKGEFALDVCNSFIPGDLPIVTDEAGEEKLRAYVENAMKRMASLGVKIVVFGSGKARTIPDTVDYAEGEAQIDRFLVCCNDLCEAYGLTLVIEPLNKNETNWVNTVAEGAKVVRRLELPHVRLLADGFHMAREEEDPAVMAENRDILLHTHLASPGKRGYPGMEGGDYETAFLKTLTDMDYDGIVTVECGFTDFAKEAALAADFMKKTLGSFS